MQLASVIFYIFVIDKALSLPSKYNQLELDSNNKTISCYKSNYNSRDFGNTNKINEILSNVKNKILLKNSTRYICGITLYKQPLGYFKISYNQIPKEDCTSNTTICDLDSKCLDLVSCCEEGHSCKFQVELISRNPRYYNETVKDCEIEYPTLTTCLKLSKRQTENLSTRLFSVFYPYIAIFSAYIQNNN